MSYKSQLFPVSGSRETPFRWAVHHSLESAPADSPDTKLLRWWLVYDSEVRPGLELPRVNWNAVLGLALATAVSASIWAGIVLVVARIWR